MLRTSIARGARERTLLSIGAAAALCLALLLANAGSALAAPTTTYTQTETIPVPPASNYAGNGGGDGWSVALSPTQVFNVFHHNGVLTVACHLQSDAANCWSPETITDAGGNNFATSGQPGLYLDQKTGKLYVYATRSSDSTAGVVCIDTTIAATNPNPFCGYTALTPAGDGPLDPGGISGVSGPMLVGSHWYAFNYVNAVNVAGAKNKLLCFDVSTDAACGGQPFAVPMGSGAVADGGFPSPATAAIGSQVIIPVNVGGVDVLACFDDSIQAGCGGSWPVATGTSYAGTDGSPFPLLDATGKITGLCLPTGTDQCYTLAGASTPTPPGMTAAIGASASWNGPAVVLGPRVYVPEWVSTVDCLDYSTGAPCAGFPKTLNNLSLLYTVNSDPQRPTCIWVNADNGQSQIQNFDAYTGGACGQGSIRVLASQFVVNQAKCTPGSYDSLQVVSPAPGTYTSGSVQFDDGDGNPISGAADRSLDAAGKVDLTGLNLNTATGLPQFLITLNGASGNPGQVVVKLTWTATYDPSCIAPGATTAQVPTTVTTSLAGGGSSGPAISVPAGTAVTDNATLAGANSATATGTVTYTAYSDSSCTTAVSTGSARPITSPGTLPPSAAVTLTTPGTYYWVASYSGDGSNFGSQSKCGDEVQTVTAAASQAPSIDGQGGSGQALRQATAHVTAGTAGDLLVAFVRADSPRGAGNTARVSGGGLTWTRVARENRALGDTEVWTARAAGPLSNVPITARLVRFPRYDVVITVIAFENAPGIGATRTFHAGSGAPSGMLTTTQANSWVFAAGNDWLHSVNRTVGPGQTIEQQSTDAAGDTYWVQSTTAPTPATGSPVTINDTGPTTDPWNLVLVEVR